MAPGGRPAAARPLEEGHPLPATTVNSRAPRPDRRTGGRPLPLAGLLAAGALAAALSVAPNPGAAAPSPGAWQICSSLIEAAEQALELPPHLLQAISKVESGRWSKQAQARVAWPWTVMAEGRGRYLPSKAAAIAEVEALRARGVRNIDVGCTQVNLLYHGEAFDTLHQALDPVHNVAYAAVFLSQLRSDTNSWTRAVGQYHSKTPKLSGRYRTKVFRAWREEKKLAYQREAEARKREREAGLGAMPRVSAILMESEPAAGRLLAEAADVKTAAAAPTAAPPGAVVATKPERVALPKREPAPQAAAAQATVKRSSKSSSAGRGVAKAAVKPKPRIAAKPRILLAELTGKAAAESEPATPTAPANPGGVTLADLFSKAR